MKQVFEINMTEGSIPKKMSTFILPIMVTNVLQILFNATDMMVVGRFAGAMELAAVGACSSLINLLVILFTGISSACNIIVATYYGAGKRDKIREVIQTAMLVALILGLVMTVFGIICAPFGLHLISTPENVTGAALIYMRIYFLSMPAMLIYNYGASITPCNRRHQETLVFSYHKRRYPYCFKFDFCDFPASWSGRRGGCGDNHTVFICFYDCFFIL